MSEEQEGWADAGRLPRRGFLKEGFLRESRKHYKPPVEGLSDAEVNCPMPSIADEVLLEGWAHICPVSSPGRGGQGSAHLVTGSTVSGWEGGRGRPGTFLISVMTSIHFFLSLRGSFQQLSHCELLPDELSCLE